METSMNGRQGLEDVRACGVMMAKGSAVIKMV